MAALRLIETLVLLLAAVLVALRARPASPPYGRRLAGIAVLLALELGVLAAFVLFQQWTGWGAAGGLGVGAAFVTQGLRAVLLLAAAGAWFGLVRPGITRTWPLVLGVACVAALGWGTSPMPSSAAAALVFVMWRMKWIEEVGGWRRALGLAGSVVLLAALSMVPLLTVSGGSTTFELTAFPGVRPPPLLLGPLAPAASAELSFVRPLDHVVQALTDLLRVQLFVAVLKFVFLPIRLAGTHLERRFAINNFLVRSIPGLIAGLTLAGTAYLGLGSMRLQQVRAGFERTLARAGTAASALAEDPSVVRGTPDAARLAAGARWLGDDGRGARVRFIAPEPDTANGPRDSVLAGGLMLAGDSLVLVAQRSAQGGGRVEVSVPVDSSYLARLMRPIGGHLVVRVRPNLVVGPYGVQLRGDTRRIVLPVSVASFDTTASLRDRRWFLGSTFVPIGDWSRGTHGIGLGSAQLDLTTTAPGLVRTLLHSVGGLAPYLGILFVFGVLFSIAETIAVRSGRSIMQSVVDEAATLRDAAKRFGAGELDYRLPVRGTDEFSVVAASFNDMAASLKRQRAELIEAERVEEDLAVARRIQVRFLPQRAPELARFDVAGVSRPSREVGGDLYDWFPHADGTLGVMLGDVAGKSVPAAMLMSNVLASLRARDEMRIDLAETLDRVNRFIVEQTEPGRFVTLFYAEADPAANTLRYVSAGHNPPLLLRADGRIEWLKDGGVPLGILGDATYAATTIGFMPDDTLIVYSDGITEAEAGPGARTAGPGDAALLYGEERIAEVARAHRGATAGALMQALLASVDAFARGTVQGDDITLAIVRRKPLA